MYTRIQMPADTPAAVAAVVRETIDPRLRDVHSMLRLPLDDDGLSAGCNFAIADTLFGVIEGVSAVLSPRKGGAWETFQSCVSSYYRSEVERPNAIYPSVSGADLPVLLSARYRNPMQHALGLTVGAPDSQGTRWPDRHGDSLFVLRDKPRLDESHVVSMEHDEWPAFLDRPTLGYESDRLVLSVEAFYVGARRLVYSVLMDAKQMGYAADDLNNLFSHRKGPEMSDIGRKIAIPQYSMVNSQATATAQTTTPDPGLFKQWDK